MTLLIWDFSNIHDNDELLLNIDDIFNIDELSSRFESLNGIVLVGAGRREGVREYFGDDYFPEGIECREVLVPITSLETRRFVVGLYILLCKDHLDFEFYQMEDAGGFGCNEDGTKSAIVLDRLSQVLQKLRTENTLYRDALHDIKEIGKTQILNVFGEVGVRYDRCVKSIEKEMQTIAEDLFGEDQVSLGSLRQFSVPRSTLEKWLRIINSGNLAGMGDESLSFRLGRIESLINACRIGDRGFRPDLGSSSWPLLYANTAAWFLRMVLVYRSTGCWSASIMCSVRSFELMLEAQTLIAGGGSFSPSDERLYIANRSIEGCGVLVSEIEKGSVRSKLTDSQERCDWAISSRGFLSARNRARLGHGLLNPNSDGMDELFKQVKCLIQRCCFPDLNREFLNAFSELKPKKFRDQLKSESLELVSDYIF